MAIETAKEALEFARQYIRILYRVDQYDESGEDEHEVAGEIALICHMQEQFEGGKIEEKDYIEFMEEKRETTFKAINTGIALGKYR